MVDDNGDLVGVVSLQDFGGALEAGPIEDKSVRDIATTEGLLVAYSDEPMWKALRRLGTRDLSRLPVVDREDERKLLGIVRRGDIIRAYNHAITRRAHHQHRVETLQLGNLDGMSFVHVNISAGAPAVGKPISEIDLPDECLVISVRRGRKLHIAHGDTELQAGDQVSIFAARDCQPVVLRTLTGELSKSEDDSIH